MKSFYNSLKNKLLSNHINSYNFTLESSNNICNTEITNAVEPKSISIELNKNLDFMKYKYNTLINNDVVIREFLIHVNNCKYHAFIIFIDGMADSISINSYILKPLMLHNNTISKKIIKK